MRAFAIHLLGLSYRHWNARKSYDSYDSVKNKFYIDTFAGHTSYPTDYSTWYFVVKQSVKVVRATSISCECTSRLLKTIIVTRNETTAMVTDPASINESAVLDENNLGYEECDPTVRRGSMSLDEEKERRASIKAVMTDPNLSPTTKRKSIQHLMDGRRNSYGNSQCCTGRTVTPACNDQTKRAEEMRPHCPHYERNCTLIAPCCGAAFGCRICHDDSPAL